MDVIARRSGWLTAEAIALILLGVFALVMPLFAGLALSLTLGILLVVAGLVGIVSAVAGRSHVHVGWSLLSAVIALIIGLVIIFFPLAGAAGLALFLGAYLLLDGVSLVGLALDHRRRGDRAWGWLLGAALIDLLLAGVILLMSATASAELIGFIIGLDLILAGIALLLLHRRGVAPPSPP